MGSCISSSPEVGSSNRSFISTLSQFSCTYFLLSEDVKVQIVLHKFPPYRICHSQQLFLSYPTRPLMVVGRVLPLSGKYLLQAPISGKPCVMYRVTVQERHHTQSGSYWLTVFTEERAADFFLCDPDCDLKVFVPGSSVPIQLHQITDVKAKTGQGASWLFEREDLPPHVEALLKRHNFEIEINGPFGMIRKREMRYIESKFEAGEQIACLGIVRPPSSSTSHSETNRDDIDGRYTSAPLSANTIAITGGGIGAGVINTSTEADITTESHLPRPPPHHSPRTLRLGKVNTLSMPPELQERNGWSPTDKKAWLDLTRKPSIIATDDFTFMTAVNIPAFRDDAAKILRVKIPPHALPGMEIQVNAPSGETVLFTVPEGSTEGDVFEIGYT